MLAEILALVSRATSVDAVAALATPVPVGKPLMTGVAIVGVVPRTTEPEPVLAVMLNAPVPPDVVTNPLEVRLESVEIF